jgi:hypothetical protein
MTAAVFAVVTNVGEQECAVVDAPLRGQHQEKVGLDARAVGHDPGDRLLVGSRSHTGRMMIQRKSGALSFPPRSLLPLLVRRAGYVPGPSRRTPGLASGSSMAVVASAGWGSAARSALSRRLMTRSLVSGNRWP